MTDQEIDLWKQALYERQQAELAANPPQPVTVTEEILEKIAALGRCTFQPASYDKRFVRSMESKQVGEELSPKQAAFLDKLTHRYRRQLGRN